MEKQITLTELKILRLLQAALHKGKFGSELVATSGGKLKRGTVYPTLLKLEQKGLVRVESVPPSEAYMRPRTRHFLTGEGVRVCNENLSELGSRPIDGWLSPSMTGAK